MWIGCKTKNGYGRMHVGSRYEGNDRNVLAHRVAYELARGPIPDGLQVDHICRTRSCINPDHLELVTQRENILRGEGGSARNARKTHCIRGHELMPPNLRIGPDGARCCRACERRKYELAGARRKALGVA
jgi:hypothetical protein